MTQTIFLIGYMGCGKSTLGAALASVMKVPFIDLDDYIEEKCEAKITEIFRTMGETAFRQLEQQALREVAAMPCIVACGGGTPCFEGNMQLMNRTGITIWLTTEVERIAARLCLPEQKAKRPLIANKTDEEIHAFITTQLAARGKNCSRPGLNTWLARCRTWKKWFWNKREKSDFAGTTDFRKGVLLL